jgi:hypothetical protein
MKIFTKFSYLSSFDGAEFAWSCPLCSLEANKRFRILKTLEFNREQIAYLKEKLFIMPTEMHTERDGRIAVAYYKGNLTAQELLQWYDDLGPIYAHADGTVHIIVDVTGLRAFPNVALRAATTNPNFPLNNANTGLFLIVTKNYLHKTMTDIVGRLYKPALTKKMQVFGTMEEALAVANKALDEELQAVNSA